MTEDLDVKIGSKAEAKWTKIKDESEAAIEQAELSIEINRAILELAKIRIQAEQ